MIIYILEEKERLSQMIAYSLDMEREQVKIYHTLQELEEASAQMRPELILLYEEQGSSWAVEIMGQMRNNASVKGIPLIILAENAAESDIVKGLDSGAELFMTAPFGAAELHAYIHAVMRRIDSETPEESIQSGGLRILPERHQVFAGKKEIKLSTTEFMILQVLLENEGRVMNSYQIAVKLKEKGKEVRPSTVKSRINLLKKKIPGGEKLFRTVRGVGYRFSADIDENCCNLLQCN